AETPGVILTGFQTGQKLKALFSQARLFVIPSYHEGLPIALLEAMSFSLPAIMSNIPANLEVSLPSEGYFEVGNVAALAAKLSQYQSASDIDYSDYLKKYDWYLIARQTMYVYQEIFQNNTFDIPSHI
ncbi:MAG: glycosyltransferase family 4 protein, partial [Psychromonas sp.]